MTDEERVSFRDLAEARERLARLEMSATALNESVKKVGDSVAELSEKLDGLTDTISQARGAWAAGKLAYGAITAAIGGIVGWIATHLPLGIAK